MGYLCDNHPDTPASVTVTNLDTGDVVALCGPDVHEWFSAMAAATAPHTVTPQELERLTEAELDRVLDSGPPMAAATEVPDEVTGDPTHDDEAGDGASSPGLPDPASSPAPTPEPVANPEEDPDLPELADLLEQARPELAQEEEHVTTDA